MKPFKFTFFLAILASFAFVSCENEPLTGTFTDESGTESQVGTDTGSGNEVVLQPFFAKLDGIEFSETSVEVTLFNNKLWIGAIDADTNKLTIGMPEDVSVGIFDIDPTNYTAIFEDNLAPTYFTRANSGSITIVTHDTINKTITGKFNYIATPTGVTIPEFKITEGEFNVSY